MERGVQLYIVIVVCYCDQIWCNMNEMEHNGEDTNPLSLAQEVNKVYNSNLRA